MDDFMSAQQLFGEYERYGDINTLELALLTLQDIIENQGSDTRRAINLKTAIDKHVDAQITHILAKCNFEEFREQVKGIDDAITFLSSSLTDEDTNKFSMLSRIKSEYFKK
jgi:DNA polymerase III delta prime subunit